MAVTGIKKQEQVAKNQQPVQAAQPYTALAGVSQNTANNLGNYQAGYQAGQQVNQAQNVWNQIQAQKPGQYQSKYSGMLDNIMAQINNPELTAQVTKAVSDYLDNPQNLVIAAKPASPVPFALIAAGAMASPADLTKTLGVTVTANGN